MIASLRRLSPEEADPELLMLGASAGAITYGAAWAGAGLPMPRCAFFAATGCPCPTCGATRCMLALIHGRVADAFAWNPLVFTGLVLLAAGNLYAAGVIAGRLPRVRFSFGAMEAQALKIAGVLALAGNWAYEIHRTF